MHHPGCTTTPSTPRGLRCESADVGDVPGACGGHVCHWVAGECIHLAQRGRPFFGGRQHQPITPFFQNDGETQIESNTVVGSSWFVLNEADNALPAADLRVLFLQVTTAGDLSGTLNAQVFPLGVSANRELLTFDFDGWPLRARRTLGGRLQRRDGLQFRRGGHGQRRFMRVQRRLGVCGGGCAADADGDGVCDDQDGAWARLTLRRVQWSRAVLECGCAPIENGECDCDGNVLDAIGVCGGDCAAERWRRGVRRRGRLHGAFDACGVCNGPGDTSAAARTLRQAPVIATATSLMSWVCAVAAVKPMPTATASVTMQKCWAAQTARRATTTRRPTWRTVLRVLLVL